MRVNIPYIKCLGMDVLFFVFLDQLRLKFHDEFFEPTAAVLTEIG